MGDPIDGQAPETFSKSGVSIIGYSKESLTSCFAYRIITCRRRGMVLLDSVVLLKASSFQLHLCRSRYYDSTVISKHHV